MPLRLQLVSYLAAAAFPLVSASAELLVLSVGYAQISFSDFIVMYIFPSTLLDV